MNYDLKRFEKSIGKSLKFEVLSILKDNSKIVEIFYAVLKSVNVEEEYIIVEQHYIESDENYNEILKSQKRKLHKNKFQVDTKTTPLNG